MSVERVPFAGGKIDRDAATRASAESLAAAWSHPDALVLRVHGSRIPVTAGGSRLALVPAASVSAEPNDRIYLGLNDGTPVFAVSVAQEPAEIGPDHEAIDASERGTDEEGAEWASALQAAVPLSEAERELVAMALAVIHWHELAGFSPVDGAPSTVADGGWSRRSATGAELFPRTDPAVIVLIEHEDRVLLGSNALWESGRFSLLAGFVEAGESLENAVAREVFEEAGVHVDNIRYVTSQPWPFPRSLMLGFRAGLADGQDPEAFVADPTEISELRWFTRDEVLHPHADLRLPGGLSIAGFLLHNWARGDLA